LLLSSQLLSPLAAKKKLRLPRLPLRLLPPRLLLLPRLKPPSLLKLPLRLLPLRPLLLRLKPPSLLKPLLRLPPLRLLLLRPLLTLPRSNSLTLATKSRPWWPAFFRSSFTSRLTNR